MRVKLIMVCLIVAASITVPAASAATLTENGGALAVGSSFTGSNEGHLEFTGGYSLECEKAHLQGTVTQNNGTVVKGEIPIGSAEFENENSTECISLLGPTAYTFTSKLCFETVKGTDNIVFTGCGSNIAYDMKTAGVTCKYESSSWSGTFKTNITSATLTISEQAAQEVGEIFFCPNEGQWDMTFKLFTTGGTTGLTMS